VAVGLYMDVHVPQAITDQLRRKGVDVLTAIEDDRATLPDELEVAAIRLNSPIPHTGIRTRRAKHRTRNGKTDRH
jgi:hypothetical protein